MTEIMTIAELWESGEYKKLKCASPNLLALKASLNYFIKHNPELASEYIMRQRLTTRKTLVIILNITKFIETYNQYYKTKGTKVVTLWSQSAIDCLERECVCEGCFYNSLSSLRNVCQMKHTVDIFLRYYGNPLNE